LTSYKIESFYAFPFYLSVFPTLFQYIDYLIYITFIRPLLEYADVVWDTKTQILTNKLENVQVEAIEELDYLTSYKIESFYAFPFYLSMFPNI
jgi:hypothetical protein